MVIKVLAIGDIANILRTLSFYTKKSKIHIINFPRDGTGLYTSIGDVDEFTNWKVKDHVKKINQIKDKFDICITTGTGERIAYLADLNYVSYYLGRDIDAPRFVKNSKEEWNNEPLHTLNFIERKFYRNAFDNATTHVAGLYVFNHLIKYTKNAINNARTPIDPTIFHQEAKPLEIKKSKFTFFSPNRMERFKGTHLLWEALQYCKTDFEIHQVNWFGETQNEERQYKEKLLQNIPTQIKFIPLVKYVDMPQYYKFSDAVIGNLWIGNHELVALESVLCKKPVIQYTDPKIKIVINGKQIQSPFLPTSKEPREIAKTLDMIVESAQFRDELLKKEYEFVKEITDPIKCAEWWDNLFANLVRKHTQSENTLHNLI